MDGLQDAHVPVMCTRIVELLSAPLQAPGAVYVDCTLGLGGHAEAILAACPEASLIGIDRDRHALPGRVLRLVGGLVNDVHRLEVLPMGMGGVRQATVAERVGLEQISELVVGAGVVDASPEPGHQRKGQTRHSADGSGAPR